MNIAQKIAKESTITFTGMVYGNINRYLYTALLARWVGVEYLGIYSLANSIMLIAEVIAKMGLETGVMRFVSRRDPEKELDDVRKIIHSALKMSGIFSIVIAGVLILLSGWLVNNVLKEVHLLQLVLIIFALTIPFNAFTLISAFATQGFKLLKYKIFTTQFINPTMLLLTMILCYWFISSEAAIMYPMLLTGILGSIVMFIILKRISKVQFKSIIASSFDKVLLSYSYPLMFVIILQTFMHWMDILMLGYFTDASTVGLYHPAARTAGLLQALLISFLSIYAPIFSQLHHEGKRTEMVRIYHLVSRWILTMAIPISLIFLIYPAKVMLIFGPAYLPSRQVLIILTGATFLQAILGAASPALSMSGYTKLVLWNTVGAFLLNLILNIILIPKWGITGAAIATFVSLATVGLARVIEVRFLLNLSFLDRKIFKPVIAGIGTGVLLVVLKPVIMDYHTIFTLTISTLCSFSLFGLVLWLLKFEPEDRDFWLGLGILKRAMKK